MIELMFSLAINVVPSPIKDAITNILGVRALMGTGKYLVLTSMVGRIKAKRRHLASSHLAQN